METMQLPLTLNIGGATVDTSVIAGVSWAKTTRDLEREFPKGSDIRLTVVARVVEVGAQDKYDAHGNIAETIKRHRVRVDDVELVELVAEADFTTVGQAAEAEAKAAADAAADGGGES